LTAGFHLGADGIYRCEAFDEHFTWQSHGFGTRAGNPSAQVTLRQIHSAIVANAKNLKDRESEGDALVTDEVNRSIGVRTADCVPILLLDSSRRAIGAVHAGWRGSAAEVVSHAVQALTENFGSRTSDIHVAVGPSIRGCCYEVGNEVAEQFHSLFPEWTPVVGKRRLDLPEANRRQLIASGVSTDHIYDCRRCTACEPDVFFSYRREPEIIDRMLASICRLS
jgi:hypothetical protein